LVERLAACFTDGRDQARVEHEVATLVGQRVIGIALGYEDLVDHDWLRHDPAMASLAGKLEARRATCAPLAGKSTLNRLEHAPWKLDRYHKIGHAAAAIERLLVDLFLHAHRQPPARIVIDLDASRARRRRLPLRSSRGQEAPEATIPCTVIRKGDSFTAAAIASAICRWTCSAVGTCSPPSCGARTVNRRGNGTPDRRAKGPPVMGVGAPPPWLARSRRRSGEQGGEAGSEGAQARFLKRQLSLPVSTMSQWWVRRSSSAVVILASPKTLGHSPKARLVVTMIEVCS
jgi:hypothetical protein